MFNACPVQKSYDIYDPRNPRNPRNPHNPHKTHYFQCVEAHFEELEMVWDARNHDSPVKTHEHIPELTHDDDYSQLPFTDVWA